MSFLTRSVLRVASAQPTVLTAHAQVRRMATLRELELRLKSVRNIEKITKVRANVLYVSHNRLNLYIPSQ